MSQSIDKSMFLTKPDGVSKHKEDIPKNKQVQHFDIINSSVFLDPNNADTEPRTIPLRGQTRAQDKRRPKADLQKPQEAPDQTIKMDIQDEKTEAQPSATGAETQKQKNRVTFKSKKERDDSTLFLTAMGDQLDSEEGDKESPRKENSYEEDDVIRKETEM